MTKTITGVASILALAHAGAATAAPVTFVLNPDHSFARFSYSHMGYSTQLQRFNKVTGKIVLDEDTKTASVDITVDTKSVDTGSPKFNADIQSVDFLDTAHYPQATYKSTGVTFYGNSPVSIQGNLTIKGVTQSVSLLVTSFKHAPSPLTKKDVIGADASCKIKRSVYHAGKYSPLVSDDVIVTVAIEAEP